VRALARINDNIFASGSWDNSIKIWNKKTGLCEKTLNGHTAYVVALHAPPIEEELVSSSCDYSIKIWNWQ